MRPAGLTLGLSERRALLDPALAAATSGLDGLVLDVGGRRIPRGRFVPPAPRHGRWLRVNLDASAGPDVVADAAALPFRDGAAAAAVCLETLEYVERPEDAMRELARILRPGGQAVVSVPFLHRADAPTDRHRFTAMRVAELATGAGLEPRSVSAQGHFFTTLAHLVRQAAANVRSPLARRALGVAVLPLTACLRRLDRLAAVRRSALLTSFSTGFLLVARKR